MTVWVPAGTNRLNGEQALAYARERHLYANGDFQRQANQQQVIQAILTEAMKLTDVNKALKVLDAAGENVSTNFTVDQLISLFNYSIKKMNRSYVKNANVINMVGSRVTGYGSSKWNESMQLNLYIYRVYQGSITDNRNAILRNINLDSKIDAPKAISFSANWVFTAPTLTNETYSEPIIHDESPDTVLNFSGKLLSEVQEWASSRGITVKVTKVHQGEEGYVDSYPENMVIAQSVRAGIKTENVTEITVSIITHEGATKNCPANSYYDSSKNACVCESGYYAKNDSDLNTGGAGCIANPTTTPTITPTTTPTTVPTTKPTAEPTVVPTVEPTIVPTIEPTAEPTTQPTIEPTIEPTTEPTAEPTTEPSEEPTDNPEPPAGNGDGNPDAEQENGTSTGFIFPNRFFNLFSKLFR